MSWEDFQLFLGRVQPPSKDKSPLEKITPNKKKLFQFLKTKIENWELLTQLTPLQVPLDVSRGVFSGDDYRVAALSKSYLTVIGIIVQSLKTIGQF